MNISLYKDQDLTLFDEWKMMDLSTISDRTKGQIIKLEMELQNEDNTRKQRRHLQNKRNRLKAKIGASQKAVDSENLITTLKDQETELNDLLKINKKCQDEGSLLSKDNKVLKSRLDFKMEELKDLEENVKIYELNMTFHAEK